jgi:hypothetical protein
VGVRLTLEVVRSVPYVVQDKRDRRQVAAEERRMKNAVAAKERVTVAEPDEHEHQEEEEEEEDGCTERSDGAKLQEQTQVEREEESKK